MPALAPKCFNTFGAPASIWEMADPMRVNLFLRRRGGCPDMLGGLDFLWHPFVGLEGLEHPALVPGRRCCILLGLGRRGVPEVDARRVQPVHVRRVGVRPEAHAELGAPEAREGVFRVAVLEAHGHGA